MKIQRSVAAPRSPHPTPIKRARSHNQCAQDQKFLRPRARAENKLSQSRALSAPFIRARTYTFFSPRARPFAPRLLKARAHRACAAAEETPNKKPVARAIFSGHYTCIGCGEVARGRVGGYGTVPEPRAGCLARLLSPRLPIERERESAMEEEEVLSSLVCLSPMGTRSLVAIYASAGIALFRE